MDVQQVCPAQAAWRMKEAESLQHDAALLKGGGSIASRREYINLRLP